MKKIKKAFAMLDNEDLALSIIGAVIGAVITGLFKCWEYLTIRPLTSSISANLINRFKNSRALKDSISDLVFFDYIISNTERIIHERINFI